MTACTTPFDGKPSEQSRMKTFLSTFLAVWVALAAASGLSPVLMAKSCAESPSGCSKHTSHRDGGKSGASSAECMRCCLVCSAFVVPRSHSVPQPDSTYLPYVLHSLEGNQ